MTLATLGEGGLLGVFSLWDLYAKLRGGKKNLSSRPSSFAEGHAGPQIDRYCEETDLELS